MIVISERAEVQRTKNNEQGGKETVQGKMKWVSGKEMDQVGLVHTHSSAAESHYFFTCQVHLCSV